MKSAKINYNGSLFWLIFWVIVFFPIALVLLLSDSAFELNQKIYKTRYNGSKFWLCFWILVFFPIAFLLIFLNGVSMTIVDYPQFERDKENISMK